MIKYGRYIDDGLVLGYFKDKNDFDVNGFNVNLDSRLKNWNNIVLHGSGMNNKNNISNNDDKNKNNNNINVKY